jgi:hypothetical protein
VYAPAAVAGIGTLPDTILDRAVVVRMRRHAPDERIRDYRERTTRPEGEALRELLAKWTEYVAGQVGDPWPDMPPGVADRPADVWEPLLAVAGLAGGEWPKLAAEACTAFIDGHGTTPRQQGHGCWPTCGRCLGTPMCSPPRRSSGNCTRAKNHRGATGTASRSMRAAWAKLLKPYQVKATQVRIGETTPRGYRRSDLHEAWRSYLPGGSETSTTSATSLASHVLDVADVAHTRQTCAVCGQPMTACEDGQTTHPWCDPGPPMTAAELAAAGFPAGLAEDTTP